ncbi:MAG: GGDEF domain-containing protein [Lachnospiraceae bacterium]|nr:GGDEF domain-containing protein [Lachnospiraceae bacterium]
MRKVMFLISTWQELYTDRMLGGIEKYIENTDIQVHAFNAYGATVEYYAKEAEIFYLPNVSDYDGVLTFYNSVNSEKYMNYFVSKCKALNIPLLNIDTEKEGVAYCGIDNYTSAYEVVEHMITEHHCKKLSFIGGPENHPDTVERAKAFKDCLEKHGLEPYSIGYYGYMRSSGGNAYKQIKESGTPFADAYICANDFAAIGFCTAAAEDGYYAPTDFKITGFDNLEEGQRFNPTIASVNRNLDELGYRSIEFLDKLMKQETTETACYVPGKFCCAPSCGCTHASDTIEKYNLLNTRTIERDHLDDVQRKARELLCGNSSFEEYQQSLVKCHYYYHIDNMFIAVNHNLSDPEKVDFDGYDDIMDLYSMTDSEQISKSKTLIPEQFNTPDCKLLLFASLHCKERTSGYSIFKYRNNIMDLMYHRTLNETCAMAIENIRQNQLLNHMNKKLQFLYIRDSLTGLYNRFGYNAFGGDCFQKNHGKIYILYIDMDNLKPLNDNYGHDMGDAALKGIANGLRVVFADTDIHVRMGGDEFLVMGPYMSEQEILEKEKKLDHFLQTYSKENHFPIPIEISMGHAVNETEPPHTSLTSMVQAADALMYQHKQKKKTAKISEKQSQ